MLNNLVKAFNKKITRSNVRRKSSIPAAVFFILTSLLTYNCAGWRKIQTEADLCNCLSVNAQNLIDLKNTNKEIEQTWERIYDLESSLYKLATLEPGTTLTLTQDEFGGYAVWEPVDHDPAEDNPLTAIGHGVSNWQITTEDTLAACSLDYDTQVANLNHAYRRHWEIIGNLHNDLIDHLDCVLYKKRLGCLSKKENELLYDLLSSLYSFKDRKIERLLDMLNNERLYYNNQFKVDTSNYVLLSNEWDFKDALRQLVGLIYDSWIEIPINSARNTNTWDIMSEIEEYNENGAFNEIALEYLLWYFKESNQTVATLFSSFDEFDNGGSESSWFTISPQSVQSKFTSVWWQVNIQRWNVEQWIIRTLDLWGNCPVTIQVSFVWELSIGVSGWQLQWAIATDPKLGIQTFTISNAGEINTRVLEMYRYCQNKYPGEGVTMTFSASSAGKQIASHMVQVH